MDQEMKKMFQLLIEKIDSQDKRFDAMDKRFDAMDKHFDTFEKQTENKFKQLNLKIENEISQKIDALFDGYQATQEKVYELDRRVTKLENAG